MIINRFFLQCKVCGNTVGVIKDSGVKMECCGQEMMWLLPNSVEAVYGEHIPIVLLEGDMPGGQADSIDLTRKEKALVALKALPDGDSEEDRRDRGILKSYARGQVLAVIAHRVNSGEGAVNRRINHYTDRVKRGIYSE